MELQSLREENRRLKQELQATRHRVVDAPFLQTMIDAIPTPVFYKDIEGRYLGCNQAFEVFSGLSRERIVGQTVLDLLPRDMALPHVHIDAELLAAGGMRVMEAKVRFPNGSTHDMLVHQALFTNASGEVAGIIGVMVDITDRKCAEEQIRYIASHDALTGLPNRSLFMDHFSKALARGRRDQTLVLLLFVDLDGFKLVNDRYGHGAGDSLLREVGVRLSDSVRETDTVARLGGDEFTVLLTGVTEVAAGARVAEAILSRLNEPFRVEGGQAYIGCSIGIAVYGRDGTTADDLIRSADAAMYAVKRMGKDAYRFASQKGQLVSVNF
ncbi:GGDEF domain-containing protein [Sulfidibacter corallicola]|uniref:Diguanylate cyclase n=1 Tax=Sulfidibacter corallicola TaxID=2818388 RepID=A0A8A4TM32_SULCO|nr:GGDEF domain-containing protein [Sulfidibacter corallicola]QTD51016.1 diguanylate cyclase [Sulfidibacter corallicola]